MTMRRQHQLDNARFLLRIKGVHAAARYMRNCGFSIEAALYLLTTGE